MLKNRIVLHIGLNAKNQRVGSAVEACGRLIPFGGYVNSEWSEKRAEYWLDNGFGAFESVAYWKEHAKNDGAVRFQRVTLIGGAAWE